LPAPGPITKSPLIIGHRGAAAVAPENTLASFARALNDGADGIEFDVRLSRDGVPVIIHDATLKRTAGLRDRVPSLSATDLENLDVGSWFNQRFPDLARPEYSSERLPTLQQVFAAMREHRASLYVELKSDGVDRKLVNRTAQLIDEWKFYDRVVVESFALGNLELVKQIDPRIRTAALFEPKREPLSLVAGRRLISRALTIGADEISLHRSAINKRTVTAADESGLAVVVWTVDSPSFVARAKRLGIKAVITNRPAEMLRARDAAY
jgi:glycerophosphoryl diester phosphodiesterase